METRVEAVHELIDRIYRDGVVHTAAGAPRTVRPIGLERARGIFLRDLCRREEVRTTLEIGMAWGLSTLLMLEALLANHASSGAHVVIDPFQTSDFDRAALASVESLGLSDLVEFHEEFSEFQLPALLKQGRVFDLIFIDGNHSFDGVFLDLFFANRLLRPGGVMVFDDTWCDPVFLACRYLQTNYGYSEIGVHPPVGPGSQRRRLYRGTIRAYRKPPSAPIRGEKELVAFHYGVGFASAGKHLRSEAVRALHNGDRRAARQALRDALRLRTRRLRTLLLMMRTYLPVPKACPVETNGHPR